MTRNVEAVQVIAGGSVYTEWEAISVSYAIKEATRSFTLRGTERPGQFRFPPGTPIQILANGTLLLSGYVNRYCPAGDANSHTVTIEGRSKSQDFIDSSAEHDTGFWENKTPDQIGQELDLYGVGIKTEVPLKPVKYWQLYQGESPFRTVERMLRMQGAVQRGLADGSIAITNATAAKQHSGALVEGWNILRFSGEITDNNRFSDYTVKGQGRVGTGEAAMSPFGEAFDEKMKRYRGKIIVNEGDTDTDRAQSRADYEKSRAAGLSVSANITTQGWRDEGGTVWEPNFIVLVQSPILLKLTQPMLIESVTLSQDNGGSGSLADLRLVDPAAYSGDGGGGSGSDAAWG